MSRRILLLSGLAILGVVINHAAAWGQIAMFYWTHRYRPVTVPNYDQLGTPLYYVLLVVRQLTVFCVPAFLFAAGFFIAYAARGSQSTLAWKTVRARIAGLLVPYFIWSMVIFIAYAFTGVSYSLGEYLARLAFFGATGSYYYIPLLCVFNVLSPLIVPVAKTKWRLLLYVSATIQLSTMGLRYLKLFGAQMPGLDLMINLTPDQLFVRWAFFFPLGVVSGFHIEQLKDWLVRFKWKLLAAMAVLGLLAILEPEVVYRTTGMDLRFVPFQISTSLYSIALILCFLAFDTAATPFSRTLYQLGSKSYGIYLLHYESMGFISRLIYHFAPWMLAYQGLLQPILLFFGLGVPLLLMEAVVKSPAKRFYRYLFS